MNTHEQYVSLETAKLLKQAGFDWECPKMYFKYTEDNNSWGDAEDTNYHNHAFDLTCNQDKILRAPTQAVAQRWLREVKGYNVQVNFDYFEDTPEAIYSVWSYEIEELVLQAPYPRYTNELQFVSYEAALEAGLQKCLMLLIEKQ